MQKKFKHFLTISFVLAMPFTRSNAQEIDLIEELLANLDSIPQQPSTMVWYLEAQGEKREVGEVDTDFFLTNDSLTVVTRVRMQGIPELWVDSTICEATSFRPLYHSSENMQRTIRIHFGDTVDVSYCSKSDGGKRLNHYNPSGYYIDSNLYPFLIRLLPLKDGYTTVLRTFEYNPDDDTSLLRYLKVTVKRKPEDQKQDVAPPLWVVKVVDPNTPDIITEFHLDGESRDYQYQSMNTPGGKMFMEPLNKSFN